MRERPQSTTKSLQNLNSKYASMTKYNHKWLRCTMLRTGLQRDSEYFIHDTVITSVPERRPGRFLTAALETTRNLAAIG